MALLNRFNLFWQWETRRGVSWRIFMRTWFFFLAGVECVWTTFMKKKKNVCCVSTKQAWRHQPIFKEILILLVNCNFRHRIRTLKLLLPSVWSGISIWKPDNIRANQEKLIQAVERRLQTHRKACFGKKKKKKSSHNSSRGLFIHLPQCSSWLFLSFFRSLGSLMIPACLSSVYLTPSSALCGLPPVLAGAQSCTDHFILWDKPAFLSNPGEAALGAPRLKTSNVWNIATGYTCGCPRAASRRLVF